MPRKPGSKQRIKAFLRGRVGKKTSAYQIQKAAGGSTEWGRRVRELRNDEGWPILTHHDDRSLKPGEYLLVSEPPEDRPYRFSRPISSRVRALVLERNGYTCQMCGAGAGEPDERKPGRKVLLHIGHIIDRSHGGDDSPGNLRALCSTCNQGAKNLAQEPPTWTYLLAQIRRATIKDQKKTLRWLRRKFEGADKTDA
ncbi:MAG: HNH endonuclease [Gammaproteobacteria bacterium]|nr:HNH endonuclease [Gammaproteobacteria bacterium]